MDLCCSVRLFAGLLVVLGLSIVFGVNSDKKDEMLIARDDIDSSTRSGNAVERNDRDGVSACKRRSSCSVNCVSGLAISELSRLRVIVIRSIESDSPLVESA